MKSPRIVRRFGLWTIPLLLCLAPHGMSLAQTNAPIAAGCLNLPPVGFVRVTAPAHATVLVSLPFDTADHSLAGVLGTQLTGSTNPAAADRVWKWDALTQSYDAAFKADGTAKDGRWFEMGSDWIESDMTLAPGEGFWVENGQAAGETLYLAGSVVLDASRAVPIEPAFNLIGFPFTAGLPLNRTRLAGVGAFGGTDPSTADQFMDIGLMQTSWLMAAPGATGAWAAVGGPAEEAALLPGVGYWYQHRGNGFIWNEPRPYAGLSTAGSGGVQGSELVSTSNGESVVLDISAAPSETNRWDIFYQDLTGTNVPDTVHGWRLAAQDLRGDPQGAFTWTDAGGNGRAAVATVFGRVYLVARSDIDDNGNGIPDDREFFLAASMDATNAVPALGPTQDAPAGVGPAPGVPGNRPSPSTTNGVPVPAQTVFRKTIYVDQAHGDDALSGRSLTAAAGEGPKRTIRAGVAAAAPGDRLVVKTGRYGESLNVAGRSIAVTIQGRVDLSGRTGPSKPPVVMPPVPPGPRSNVAAVVTGTLQ